MVHSWTDVKKAERFTILDTARVPEKPAKPNRPVLYGVSVALALALAMVFGCACEWKKNVILGEWELPGNVVVLGRIPSIQANAPSRAAGSSAASLAGPGRLAWKLGILTSLMAIRKG